MLTVHTSIYIYIYNTHVHTLTENIPDQKKKILSHTFYDRLSFQRKVPFYYIMLPFHCGSGQTHTHIHKRIPRRTPPQSDT